MTQPSTVAVTLAELSAAAIRILGLGLLAALVTLAVAFVHRWYARDRIPEGPGVLIGVAVVAIVLNTQSALQSAILGQSDLLSPSAAAFTVVAFAVAAVFADVGRRMGDRAGRGTAPTTALRELGDMGQIVRSGGRAVTVELPESVEEIGDIDGYDPVPEEDKETLVGTSLVFPRGLTVAELRDRLSQRLREDYGIGHVDVEVTAAGDVEYLAVGLRAAGIGVTLGPGTAAVAITADPPNAASPGDTVQVWTSGDDPRRVTTGEFRGAAGDVVTLALDEVDARELDETNRYRLVTMPGDEAPERDFVSLLRAADETMGVATVTEGSSLVGIPVGALDVTVVAVQSGDGIEAIPPRSRTLVPGDTVYVVARPEDIRRVESAASETPDEAGTGSE